MPLPRREPFSGHRTAPLASTSRSLSHSLSSAVPHAKPLLKHRFQPTAVSPVAATAVKLAAGSPTSPPSLPHPPPTVQSRSDDPDPIYPE
jgi:hypothetical protein